MISKKRSDQSYIAFWIMFVLGLAASVAMAFWVEWAFFALASWIAVLLMGWFCNDR